MSRRVAFICMTIVTAVAITLRLQQIDSHSFWLDEAYSWTMATKYSFAEIVRRTANDFHPPLYFMILKCWIGVFGDSEVAQRLLSVTFDTLAVLMLYLLCRDAFAKTTDADGKHEGRMIGLLAAAMHAVSGIHIQWSIETRMYSMAAFLSVASSWLLLRGLASPRRHWWIAYSIAASALLYTHNYGMFTVFGQGCCFLADASVRKIMAGRSNQREVARNVVEPSMIAAMITVAVIGLAYLPWLSVLRTQTQQARDDYWIPDMNW